jgi:hypothetical protein
MWVIISLRGIPHIKRSKYPLTLPILLVKYSKVSFLLLIKLYSYHFLKLGKNIILDRKLATYSKF